MSKWNNAAEWAALCSGTACPICLQGKPLGIVLELESGYLTSGDDVGVKGYCCLVHRRHAVELHDLSDAEGAAFMRDIQRISAALAKVTGAIKLNYEIHGNTLPHLHVHFFPRYPGDPFEGGPIDPRKVRGTHVYVGDAYAGFVRALKQAVEQTG
jgi:diadenosine tetraphosphate (Ap4A) HIT family hydrolase